MPFHKGHEYCLRTAAKECETVYVILFSGGSEEEKILKEKPYEWLSAKARLRQIEKVCRKYQGVARMIPVAIDVTELRKTLGDDTWEGETPLVREIVGDRLDAVYGSEPSYREYFKKAYPEADIRIVDEKREKYPISGTMIREMDEEEQRKWMV